MNERRFLLIRGVADLAVAALLGALVSVPASAVCSVDPCLAASSALDCDQDGATDAQECVTGFQTSAGAAIDLPSCLAAGATQPDCLDPTVPDLFLHFEKAVGFVDASGTLVGSAYDQLGLSNAEIFDALTRPPAQGGLGLRVHVIDPTTTSLLSSPQPNSVSPGVAALRVEEVRETLAFTCPIDSPLGRVAPVSSAAGMNGQNVARIFSDRILAHVDCVHDSVSPPTPASGRLADKRNLLIHTTDHEIGHGVALAPEDVSRFGGHHFKAGSGCMLDESTVVSVKRNVVNFAVALDFCGPSQDQTAAAENSAAFSPPLHVFCEDRDNYDQDGYTTACLPAGP